MLKNFISSIISMVKVFTSKPKISEILATVLTYLPDIVTKVIQFGGANTKEKFDDFLATLDAYTGSDLGAVDLDHDMPKEQQEAFWDHIKEAARIMGYHQLKLPGYYQEIS
ncbi:MAG: hypothetical protein NTV06_06260 [candidate division Zixibacteria bacterium]|nr:hypothetical protein [candidate division Zixibacteria bacterium]